MQIPAELLLAFGQERARLSKVYRESSPKTQEAIYRLYVEGNTTTSVKQLAEVRQFPVKIRTAGNRIKLYI